MSRKVVESWNRIAAWLGAHAPEMLELLQSPVSQEQLDAAAAEMGLVFPNDFVAFYQIVDGYDPDDDPSSIFPSWDEWDDVAFGPLALEAIVQEWKMLKELLDGGDFAGLAPDSAQGVANDWWHPGWIPFADNGGGDYVCIDMAPAEGGRAGQVISHSHESGEHRVLATSLADYLNDLADALEDNTLEYSEEDGVRRRRSDD
ncbi:MAG: SMI1/KNR4 family protein [Anaerolineae bacterium]